MERKQKREVSKRDKGRGIVGEVRGHRAREEQEDKS